MGATYGPCIRTAVLFQQSNTAECVETAGGARSAGAVNSNGTRAGTAANTGAATGTGTVADADADADATNTPCVATATTKASCAIERRAGQSSEGRCERG